VARLARVPHPRATALAIFVALSFLYFGLPVAAHPGRDYIGLGFDPQLFVWAFAWWPHAIGNAENPFVTHAVWAPVGVNLAWTTSIPGLALALTPVTLLAGPVVSYNVVSVLLPALAAWTAFLLCRRLTRSFWPSLAGGYLFGFSSYMLGQTEGHLHMSSVFLLPLLALTVLAFLDGSLGRLRFAGLLGALLAFQLLLSTEVFFTATLGLAVCTLVAFATAPSVRRRLVRGIPPALAAYALAALVASPILVYALTDFEGESLNDPDDFPADLANLVVPTHLSALSRGPARTVAASFLGNSSENGAYLGVPLLVIVGWFCWRARRSEGGRFLAAVLAVGIVTELGTELHVRGHAYFPLPWKLVAELPAFNNVLPVRFSAYVALAAAVAASLWAAASPPSTTVRIALTGAAVLALAPHPWLDEWRTHPNRPTFFTAGHDRACIGEAENVLVLPFPSWGDSMLWQAESGFRFRLADGSLSPAIPSGVPNRPTALALLSNDVPTGGAEEIVRFARGLGATVILVDGDRSEPWRTVLDDAGLTGAHVGDTFVYRLEGAAPGPCPP
jgi:hypothetical protein